MFTGIVEKTTTVVSVTKKRDTLVVRLKKPASLKLVKGQSISVDGICSTVVSHAATYFDVVYMPQTLKMSTAGHFKKGTVVNIEKSLTLQSFVDGHLVQGHVDAMASLADIKKSGDSSVMSFTLPKELLPFVVPQGSICINGVSLTVASVTGTTCKVALIPFTLKHTNLGQLKRGSLVNVEVDMVARYLGKALRAMVMGNAKKNRE